ncbi:MAG: hypothetical protein SOW56_06810, partial [Bacteroidaceae bacterium]|nr:hypothetical protein [Bacteroidaceae bacterium]
LSIYFAEMQPIFAFTIAKIVQTESKRKRLGDLFCRGAAYFRFYGSKDSANQAQKKATWRIFKQYTCRFVIRVLNGFHLYDHPICFCSYSFNQKSDYFHFVSSIKLIKVMRNERFTMQKSPSPIFFTNKKHKKKHKMINF